MTDKKTPREDELDEEPTSADEPNDEELDDEYDDDEYDDEELDDDEPERQPSAAKGARDDKSSAEPQGTSKATLVLAIAISALVAGAGGWYVRGQAPMHASPEPPVGPASSGSGAAEMAGPCKSWTEKLCAKAGDKSEGCQQAKAAAKFLPASACHAALQDVEATAKKLGSMRSTCEQLVSKLCADLGPETETCKMVQARTKVFPVKQCQMMLGKYDQVLGELRQMEKRNAPLSDELAKKNAAGDGPSFGPADAKVTVVEYSDFECPYCSKAAKTLSQLKEKYREKSVRFVFRQFPLRSHRNARMAAQASLEAHAQGKFWQLHDLMFENQRKLTRKDIEGYAEKLGLDMAKFRKALDDKSHDKAVQTDLDLGKEVGVGGTPSMFIGTKRVSDATDLDGVSKVIDEQLGKS